MTGRPTRPVRRPTVSLATPPRPRAQRRRTPAAVVTVLAVAAGLLTIAATTLVTSGHSRAGVSPVAPSDVATIVAEPAVLDPGTVAGLTAQQWSTTDPQDQRAVSTLTLAGDIAMDDAVTAVVDRAVDRYEAARTPGAADELAITTDAVLAAGPMLGLRVRAVQYTGGAHATSTQITTYTDGTHVWASPELVTDPAAVARTVGPALRQAGLAAADPDPTMVGDDLRLTDDGALVAVLAPGTAAAPAAGTVAVRIAPSNVPALLSDAGRAVRDAALAGQPFAGAPSTTPEEPQGVTGPASAPADPGPAPSTDVDCRVEKCLALTFDDGPGPHTSQLLDELDELNVRATFFLVGTQVAAYPDLAAREHAAGHAQGNHTWDHPDLRRLTPDQITDELDRTAHAIQDATGTAPTLVRPPYGSVDDTVLSILSGRDETAILWDVDTEDWKNRDAAETTRRALAGAHPGAIILMHDIHPSTVDAVPGIIDALHAQGYTLVTVPELLAARDDSTTEVFSG